MHIGLSVPLGLAVIGSLPAYGAVRDYIGPFPKISRSGQDPVDASNLGR